MKRYLLPFLALPFMASASPSVVSSIYPLQQIANAVTGQETDLIADSYLSPHDYSVKPSNAEQINSSDIVVWIGAAMMPQLDSYIDKREESGNTIITAAKLKGITLLKGHHHHHHGHEEAHGEHHDEHHHDEHKHENHKEDHHKAHDEHKHEHHDEHEKHEAHHNEHKHEHHEEHDKHDEHNDKEALSYDPHLWLSPDNAKVIASAISKALIEKDPSHKTRYQKNLAKFISDIDKTEHNILSQFESEPPAKFFVFHDAYRYFEKKFGIEQSGQVLAHAGQAVRAKHVTELEQQLKASPNACLFQEPQFKAPIVKKLAASAKVNISTLDPIGYNKKNIGYPAILQNIANTLVNCSKK